MGNRRLPDGFIEEQERAKKRAEARRNGRPSHHMGYAIDEGGNYLYDDLGNYILGDGVVYVYDEYGNQLYDENGGYVLQDADGLLIGENYGDDGYGGYVLPEDTSATDPHDSVTNTSRSTDTYAGGQSAVPSEMGQEDMHPRPAEMWWATCSRRCLYTWEGVQGFFVTLFEMPDQPYLFVQVHEVEEVKRGGFFGKKSRDHSNDEVRVSYLSVEVGALDQGYVEQNIASDPHKALRTLSGIDNDGSDFDTHGGGGHSDGSMQERSGEQGGNGLSDTSAVMDDSSRATRKRDAAASSMSAPNDDTAQRL